MAHTYIYICSFQLHLRYFRIMQQHNKWQGIFISFQDRHRISPAHLVARIVAMLIFVWIVSNPCCDVFFNLGRILRISSSFGALHPPTSNVTEPHTNLTEPKIWRLVPNLSVTIVSSLKGGFVEQTEEEGRQYSLYKLYGLVVDLCFRLFCFA